MKTEEQLDRELDQEMETIRRKQIAFYGGLRKAEKHRSEEGPRRTAGRLITEDEIDQIQIAESMGDFDDPEERHYRHLYGC